MVPKPNTAKGRPQFHLTLYLVFGGTQLVVSYAEAAQGKRDYSLLAPSRVHHLKTHHQTKLMHATIFS
jgi:hypothetical protein